MSRSQSKGKSRIGLALAGGGPEGSIYELGALRARVQALEERVEKLENTD